MRERDIEGQKGKRIHAYEQDGPISTRHKHGVHLGSWRSFLFSFRLAFFCLSLSWLQTGEPFNIRLSDSLNYKSEKWESEITRLNQPVFIERRRSGLAILSLFVNYWPTPWNAAHKDSFTHYVGHTTNNWVSPNCVWRGGRNGHG